ncbi:MAG: endonuclease/exonuclease/phosphatase family protein [Oscillospiraceae bacterium]|nr:endonuclease/exonuclease/phosphatase family protein [Oscillospiraceae bacterium]
MEQLRILSHNLWKNDRNRPAWQQQGLDCSAGARIPRFAQLYAELIPDIMALQEVSQQMAALLMQQFSAMQLPYALIEGGDTPILYRTDRFSLLHSEFARYPETVPALEGSFNNYGTKSYCIAALRHTESGAPLLAASTHLWWKSSDPQSPKYQPHSDAARLWQLQQLCGRLDALRQQFGGAAFLAGDLNAVLRSPALQSALAQGWQHARLLAAECDADSSGLHRCGAEGFDSAAPQSSFAQSIDHILCKGVGAGCLQRYFRHLPQEAFSLTDHAAVCVDARF